LLEEKLKDKFVIDNAVCVSNGTIALQIAIEAVSDTRAVITTPFSYIATLNSILWQKRNHLFVDINPITLNIDVKKLRTKLVEQKGNVGTILVTHVYGQPCEVNSIAELAEEFGCKVIYDAAHCFNVKVNGRSIFEFGDISCTSFHATKIFHTVEGGSIFTKNHKIGNVVRRLRNFGHSDENAFENVGINGKMSELHAAVGIVNLSHVDDRIKQSKEIFFAYHNILSQKYEVMRIEKNIDYNYSYFPILFKNYKDRETMIEKLKSQKIIPRRYFYPSLNLVFSQIGERMPVAESAAERVLCIPMHADLEKDEQEKIIEILMS
jgi:dTDP-4-amino-4,6-dideoxygalactose transaminase